MNSQANLVSVLIIDDNANSLEFVSAALSRPGLRVLTTSNPRAALCLISQHRPKVVITDWVMPGMSGLALLDYVKKFDPEIDVIIMSAEGSRELLDRAFDHGASDYLRKPVSLAMLRKHVGRRLQRHFEPPVL